MIGGAFIVLKLKLRTELPSKSRFSNVTSQDELKVYVLTIFTQVACAYRNFGIPAEDLLGYWLVSAATNVALAFIIYRIAFVRVFWNLEMNDLFTVCYGRLLTLKVVFEVDQDMQAYLQLLYFAIFQTHVSRLLLSWSFEALKIDVFDKGVSVRRLLLGCYLFEYYMKVSSPEALPQREQLLAFHYRGIFANHIDRVRLNDTSVLQDRDNQKKFHRLLISYLETFPNANIQLIKLMLMFRVIHILPYLKTIKPAMEKIRATNGTGFFAAFDTFQYKVLCESKLDALSSKKESTDSRDNPDFLDIERAFRAIAVYKELHLRLERVMSSTKKIFNTVADSSKNSASLIYQMNSESYCLKTKLDKSIASMMKLEDPENLYSYFYPMLIFYYSLIKYDMSTAERWMEVDSVALKVEMVKEALGQITDVSINYSDFIGNLSKEQFLSKNVNDLLPVSFAAAHTSKMYHLKDFTGVNQHRSILMVDFNGCLRTPHGLVKFLPSVGQSVSALVLLTFDLEKKFSFIIADHEYRILGSDPVMTSLFKRTGMTTGSATSNLLSISTDLVATIKLLKLFKKLSDPTLDENPDDNTPFRRHLAESMRDMVDRALHQGLVYKIDEDSPLFDLIGDRSLLVKFEFKQYFDLSVIKLMIKKSSLNATTEEHGPIITGLKKGHKDQRSKNQAFGISDIQSDTDHLTNRVNNAPDLLGRVGSENNFIQSDFIKDNAAKEELGHEVGGLRGFDEMLKPAAKLIQKQIEKSSNVLEGDFNLMGHLSKFINNVFDAEPTEVQEVVKILSFGKINSAGSRDGKPLREKQSGNQEEAGNFVNLFSGLQIEPVPVPEKVETITYSSSDVGEAQENPPEQVEAAATQKKRPVNIIVPAKNSKLYITEQPTKPSDDQPEKKGRTALKKLKTKAAILKETMSHTHKASKDSSHNSKVTGQALAPIVSTGKPSYTADKSLANIKIASSSTIAGLLNQIMVRSADQKKETPVTKDQHETESISSSVMSVNSRANKMLMKNTGLRLNKLPKRRLLRWVLIVAFYLVAATFITTELLNNHSIGFLVKTEKYFRAYSVVAHLDTNFKLGLQVYIVNLHLVYSFLYPYIKAADLTPEELTSRRQHQQLIVTSFRKLAGVPLVTPILIRLADNVQESLIGSIERYVSSTNMKTLPADVREMMFGSSIKAKVSVSSDMKPDLLFEANLNSYMGYFIRKVENMSSVLIPLAPIIDAPVVPLTVPQARLDQILLKQLPDLFSTVSNSFDGIFEHMQTILKRINTAITVEEAKIFTRWSIIYMGIFIAAVLVFLVATVWLGVRLGEFFFSVLRQYENLRPEELQLMRLVAAARIEFFQDYKLDELSMLEKYKRSTYSGFLEQREVEVLSHKSLDLFATKQIKRIKRLRFNFSFTSSKTIWLLCFVSLVVASVIAVVIFFEYSVITEVTQTVEFYATTYDKFMDVYLSFFYSILYSRFGNFIKSDDHFVYDVIQTQRNEQYIPNLLGYLMEKREKLQYHFGTENGALIEQMLFSSVCNSLNKSSSSYAIESSICLQHLPARQGLIAFLNAENDYLKEIRDQIEGDQGFREASKTRPDIFPFNSHIFQLTNQNLLFVHRLIFSKTGLSLIMAAGEQEIFLKLSQVNSLILFINRIGNYSVIMLFAVLFLWLVIRSFDQNLATSLETVRSLLPEVLVQNKLVFRVFDDAFPISI